jgi:peptidylglycine monooxygenase
MRNFQNLCKGQHLKSFPNSIKADSYVTFFFFNSMSKLAGVILLGTGGVIAPMKTEHMETVCSIREKKTIYPFAYRTHTHSLGKFFDLSIKILLKQNSFDSSIKILGKVVSGYKVRKDENGIDQWTLLGKRDPLTPQMFYPVNNTDSILYDDRLAARCTMESNRLTQTHIG